LQRAVIDRLVVFADHALQPLRREPGHRRRNDLLLDRPGARRLWQCRERAGARGPIINESLDAAGQRKPYAWTDNYGVLFNPDRWRSFVKKLPEPVIVLAAALIGLVAYPLIKT